MFIFGLKVRENLSLLHASFLDSLLWCWEKSSFWNIHHRAWWALGWSEGKGGKVSYDSFSPGRSLARFLLFTSIPASEQSRKAKREIICRNRFNFVFIFLLHPSSPCAHSLLILILSLSFFRRWCVPLPPSLLFHLVRWSESILS